MDSDGSRVAQCWACEWLGNAIRRRPATVRIGRSDCAHNPHVDSSNDPESCIRQHYPLVDPSRSARGVTGSNDDDVPPPGAPGSDGECRSGRAARVGSWLFSANRSQNRSRTQSGREVGFLQLYAYSTAPPAGLETNTQFFSTQHDGKAPFARKQMSGTTVFVFEYPNEPDSKYQYSWLRHGILSNFDGARPVVPGGLHVY